MGFIRLSLSFFARTTAPRIAASNNKDNISNGMYIQQLQKNIDRFFELEFEGQVGEKFVAKLLDVNNEILKFQIDNKIEEVNFNNIKSAKVVVRF